MTENEALTIYVYLYIYTDKFYVVYIWRCQVAPKNKGKNYTIFLSSQTMVKQTFMHKKYAAAMRLSLLPLPLPLTIATIYTFLINHWLLSLLQSISFLL